MNEGGNRAAHRKPAIQKIAGVEHYSGGGIESESLSFALACMMCVAIIIFSLHNKKSMTNHRRHATVMPSGCQPA